jgi:hypothetical protein
VLRIVFRALCVAVLLSGAVTPAQAQGDAAAQKAAKASAEQRKQMHENRPAGKAVQGARTSRHAGKAMPAAASKARLAAATPVALRPSPSARWNAQSKDWGKPINNLSFKRAPGCLVPYRIVSQCLANLPPMQAADWW